MVYNFLIKLTDHEYDSFIDQTGAGTNGRKISSMIRKKNGEISRDEIFKRVFKKKRSVENDYLLRNELSVLKKKLELFILENSVTDIPAYVDYYKPYVLAQWCLKRTLINEAEKYISEAILIAKENNGWNGLLKINRIRLQITQHSKSSYHAKLELMQSIEADHIHYLKEYISEEVRYADFIRAGSNKLSANLRKTDLPFNSTSMLSVNLEQSKSRIAHFYHLKSKAYSHSGKEAIYFLQQAIACLNENWEMFLKEEERLVCMSAMAMEYSVSGDYEQASRVFEEISTHPEFDHFMSKNALLFNYCTTLLKLKEYKKAIIYLEELENTNVEPIVKERLYTMKCNCYIFMKEPNKLKEILPVHLQSYDISVRVYYRFLYIIYYLLANKTDFAERELTNLKQMKHLDETDYQPLAKIFEKYLVANESVQIKSRDRQKRINALKDELFIFKKDHLLISSQLPGMWIIEQSEALII